MSDTKQLAFSAAQIDAILAAAAKCSNRNLLDNWYFGNPVDQRQGLVVPPGTTYKKAIPPDFPVAGTATKYIQVRFVDTHGSAIFSDPNGGDFDCFVPVTNCVRGYTGAGYGIDRWKAANPYTVLIKDGYIQLISGVQNGFYAQPLDGIFTKLPGKTVTMSVFAEVISGEAYLNVRDGNSVSKKITNGLTSVTKTIISAPTEDTAVIYATKDAVINVYAAKLELGTQQTLAHQDENGNWVLNEIPDYGQELAKCQRYYQLYSSADKRPVKTVDCRPTMRVDPVQGTIVIDGITYYYNSAEL